MTSLGIFSWRRGTVYVLVRSEVADAVVSATTVSKQGGELREVFTIGKSPSSATLESLGF